MYWKVDHTSLAHSHITATQPSRPIDLQACDCSRLVPTAHATASARILSPPPAEYGTQFASSLSLAMSSQLQHKLRVQLLYRRILKEQLNWKPQRDVWLQNALYTRMLFEENKALRDTGDIEAALGDGTRWLESRKHPDPYTSHNLTH